METTEMNIPRLMEITQPTREQLIELLDGTEKLRQELEAENKLSRSAWLDAKADKLRMDYLENVVEDCREQIFWTQDRHGGLRASIDYAMNQDVVHNTFLASNGELNHE